MTDDKNEQRAFDVKFKQFEMAVSERRLEVGLFWQRSLFFWGLIAAAFVSYSSLAHDAMPRLVISCFGVICSLAWTLANRGSKYWYQSWGEKSCLRRFEDLEGGLYKLDIPTIETNFLGAQRYSVTTLTIALSDFTFLMWIALMVACALQLNWYPTNWAALILIWLTLVYVVVLFLRGRFRSKNSNEGLTAGLVD